MKYDSESTRLNMGQVKNDYDHDNGLCIEGIVAHSNWGVGWVVQNCKHDLINGAI